MSRQKYSTKTEAEQVNKIDISWLRKHNYLDGRWGLGETNSIRFQIASKNNPAGIFDYDYIRFFIPHVFWDGEKRYSPCDVELITTTCNYGGQRYWFTCPQPSCQRRARTLYLHNNYIACRHCHELTYKSKNFGKKSRNYEFIHLMNVIPTLVGLTENLRSRYYDGKPTRRFRRFIKYHDKNQKYVDMFLEEIKNNPIFDDF